MENQPGNLIRYIFVLTTLLGVNKCIEFMMNIRETVTQWLIDASTWESEHKIENLVAGLREDVTYPLDTTCTNKVVYIV